MTAFDSVEALVAQMADDVDRARALLLERRVRPASPDPTVATEQWFLQHGLSYFVPEERRAARAGPARAPGRCRWSWSWRCSPPAPAGCWRGSRTRSPWRPALLLSLGLAAADVVRPHRAAGAADRDLGAGAGRRAACARCCR